MLGTGFLCQQSMAFQGKRGMRHFYQKQVEKLEEQWRQAQLTSDTATMDRLLADDYIGIGRTGIVTTKAQTIERYQKRTVVVKKLDISDMKVAIHGETAVVTAKADVDATDNGAAIHNSFRYTRVYVHTPGVGWKIENSESTRVFPEKDSAAPASKSPSPASQTPTPTAPAPQK